MRKPVEQAIVDLQLVAEWMEGNNEGNTSVDYAFSFTCISNVMSYLSEVALQNSNLEGRDALIRQRDGYQVKVVAFREVLLLTKATLEQGGGLSTRIAANGPTLREVIEKALGLEEGTQP